MKETVRCLTRKGKTFYYLVFKNELSYININYACNDNKMLLISSDTIKKTSFIFIKKPIKGQRKEES